MELGPQAICLIHHECGLEQRDDPKVGALVGKFVVRLRVLGLQMVWLGALALQMVWLGTLALQVVGLGTLAAQLLRLGTLAVQLLETSGRLPETWRLLRKGL